MTPRGGYQLLAAGSTDSGLHVKRKFSGVLPPAVTTVINQDQLFQIYQLVPFTSRSARQRGAQCGEMWRYFRYTEWKWALSTTGKNASIAPFARA